MKVAALRVVGVLSVLLVACVIEKAPDLPAPAASDAPLASAAPSTAPSTAVAPSATPTPLGSSAVSP